MRDLICFWSFTCKIKPKNYSLVYFYHCIYNVGSRNFKW